MFDDGIVHVQTRIPTGVFDRRMLHQCLDMFLVDPPVVIILVQQYLNDSHTLSRSSES